MSESLILALAGVAVAAVGTSLQRLRRHHAADRQRVAHLQSLLGEAQALAGLGVWEWDIASGRITWSPEVFRIHGLDPASEPPGYEELLTLFHPDDAERVAASVRTCVETGTPYALDLRIRRPDGSEGWVAARGKLERDGAGLPARVVGIVLDISARKATEEAIRVQEARWASAIAASRDLVWEWDLVSGEAWVSGVTQLENRAAPGVADTAAHERRQLLGGHDPAWFLDRVHPDDQARVEAAFRDHLTGATPLLDCTYRYRAAGGHWRWFATRGCCARDDTGRPVRILGSSRDVSSDREREGQLRLFKAAVEHAHDAIVITEAQALDEPGPRILYVNEGFTRMTGYRPAEVLGRSPRMFQTPATDRATLERVRRALAQWEPVQVEVCNRHRDGHDYWIEMSIVPIADDTGWYTHWVSIQRDVTARKALETTLVAARDAAEAAARAKAEFLANMSHEIRTPLNGILGMAELLGETALDAEQADYQRTILQSGEALLGVLNDILDFSRLEAGGVALEARPFDPAAVAADAHALFRKAAADKGLAYEVEAAPCLPALIGDAQRLRQVLLNLVGNAIKFTAAGAVSVRVDVTPDDAGGAAVRYAVRDTGIGIGAAAQERIFRPFEQADGSMTRRFGGTGLGLAIARRLVLLMGGTLTVDSVEGEGSTFTVALHLPLAAPPAALTR